MSLITTNDLIELTKVGLSEIYLNEVDAPGAIYTDLFDVRDSDRATEEELKLSGFGLVPVWNADGGSVNYDKPISGTRVLFSHTDYSLAWVISHKMLRDDLYKRISRDLAASAGLATRHSIEIDAANLFNTGFTVNGPDGVPLFSDSHPLLGGGTQSNLLPAAALSESAIAAAIGKIRRSVNERGQPVFYEPEILLVPPELQFTAKKILNVSDRPEPVENSSGSVVAASSIQNVFRGVIPRIIVSPYLTGTSVYFILAVKKQRKLKFWWRERPWYDAHKDFDTKGVANSVAYAYSIGYPDYYGVWGSAGA